MVGNQDQNAPSLRVSKCTTDGCRDHVMEVHVEVDLPPRVWVEIGYAEQLRFAADVVFEVACIAVETAGYSR